MDLNWRELTEEDVHIDPVLALLTESAEPVPLNALVLEVAKEWIRRHPAPQPYDSARTYTSGTILHLADGRTTRIAHINDGYNPVQGHFQILTFAEAGISPLAAGLGQGAPDSTSEPTDAVDEAEIETQARDLLRSNVGPHLRRIVRETLQANERLVSFGDEWWLADKLPYRVTPDEIACVRNLCAQGNLTPLSPYGLAQQLWNVSPQDTLQMRLATFSLNCALDRCKDLRYLRVGGWILAERLPDLRVNRQPHVPRIRSRLKAEGYAPEEVEAELEVEQSLAQTLEDEAEPTTDEGSERTTGDVWQDLDYWRETLTRPEARIKLLGQHYIEGFLPLHKNELRRGARLWSWDFPSSTSW